MSRSQRWRVTLAIVGLILVFASVVALAYAFWPIESVREQTPIEPTLFAPPQSAIESLRFG